MTQKKLDELIRACHHQGYADGDSGSYLRDFTYEQWEVIKQGLKLISQLSQAARICSE